MAKWGPAVWLVFLRLFQALATLVSAILNGYLLVYINANHLGLTDFMFELEIMSCCVLIYTGIVLLIQHTGARRKRAPAALIIAFIAGDAVFLGVTIGIISILSRTGVPADCGGLTRSNFTKDDAPNNPPPGYQTVRFGSGDDKGELDKYCGMEKAYFYISILTVYAYVATVLLQVFRIYDTLYTANSVVDERLRTAYELAAVRKKHSQCLTCQSETSSSPPLQEGVTTPRTLSTRISTLAPSRRSSAGSVSPSSGIPPVNLERRTSTYAMPPQQADRRTSNLIPTASASLEPHNVQARRPLSHFGPDAGPEGMLIATQSTIDRDAAEAEAEAAMVTDGYRPSSCLPPYTPAPASTSAGRMLGHAGESNEIRLSEYVKGQTRAQDMKDAGDMC